MKVEGCLDQLDEIAILKFSFHPLVISAHYVDVLCVHSSLPSEYWHCKRPRVEALYDSPLTLIVSGVLPTRSLYSVHGHLVVGSLLFVDYVYYGAVKYIDLMCESSECITKTS